MESQVGYERLFDPQDIFFSTTDLKGVIQNTNRTFDTLSRYSRERLIGAPHNIIRHLDMPAGLFRLIWDDLQSQRPACGYITNRAVDGLDYRVFATIVPLRQGYLSVRIKPMDGATRGRVEEAYRRVRAKERDLQARGASRHQLGEFGGRELAAEFQALGFSSLHDMTLVTLPREVAALVDSGVRVPAAAPESLGAVARILNTVAAMEKDTNALVFELDEYLRLITSMEATHASVRAVETRVGRIGQLVSHDAGNGTQTKAQMLAERVSELTGAAGAELTGLPSRLQVLHQSVTELRFSVALMRLLTLMVGRFAQSILDGSEVDATRSLTDLCEALESGFRGLGPVLRAVSTQVAQLNDALHTVTSSLDRAARRLGQWVDLRGGGAGSSGSATVDEVAQLTSRGFPEVRSLAELAAECRGLHLPYDENIAAQRLATVRSALAELI
ncbi:diguanylate cyclase [Actinomyces viscosus]|uniref:Aerotaxis receptor n=1 Tax=Actinomyces viscosus TaxID=1656 RepID=A0A3S4VXU1_ACTVI|nr:diguanylate cyclase [Actinomyces viscosus]TFH52685.1 diguanylate cyclase [Actinomyces viscosus]VEI16946.1 Aerotaxis receptor [Actinomyces viscosus]